MRYLIETIDTCLGRLHPDYYIQYPSHYQISCTPLCTLLVPDKEQDIAEQIITRSDTTNQIIYPDKASISNNMIYFMRRCNEYDAVDSTIGSIIRGLHDKDPSRYITYQSKPYIRTMHQQYTPLSVTYTIITISADRGAQVPVAILISHEARST